MFSIQFYMHVLYECLIFYDHHLFDALSVWPLVRILFLSLQLLNCLVKVRHVKRCCWLLQRWSQVRSMQELHWRFLPKRSSENLHHSLNNELGLLSDAYCSICLLFLLSASGNIWPLSLLLLQNLVEIYPKQKPF